MTISNVKSTIKIAHDTSEFCAVRLFPL